MTGQTVRNMREHTFSFLQRFPVAYALAISLLLSGCGGGGGLTVESDSGGSVSSSGAGETNTNTSGLNQLVFSDLRRTKVNETITFPVLGSDIDTAGAISVTQQPANGNLSVGGKQLTFTPNNGVSGYSVAKIKVDWLDGSTDTATIELYTEQVGKETQFDSASGVQAAINNAKAGDRIYLKGGQSYNLSPSIDNVGGTPEAPIVLGSYGGGRAIINGMTFGDNVGRFIVQDIEIANSSGDGILSWNDPGHNMNVVFDNIEVSGAGNNGINWQERGSGSLTIVHSYIHDNDSNGILGGADDTKILNSIVSRNHDTKDYSGGPMAWNIYVGPIDNSLLIEGNTLEDSEGLLKLRAPHNFVVQKNTLRRSWIIGIGGGGQSGITMENGLIAHNLIENGGNPMSFGDSDGDAGGGISNVEVRNNVAIGGHYAGGFTNGGTFNATDSGDSNSNFRVHDNIFWGHETHGFGGAYLGHSDLEFYNNIVGGGYAGGDRGWTNYVIDMSSSANVYDNVLYKFYSDTDLGVAESNGNTVTTTIPQAVQSVLDSQ